jgi:hypothetical protein
MVVWRVLTKSPTQGGQGGEGPWQGHTSLYSWIIRQLEHNTHAPLITNMKFPLSLPNLDALHC